jgi:hypothetical protein
MRAFVHGARRCHQRLDAAFRRRANPALLHAPGDAVTKPELTIDLAARRCAFGGRTSSEGDVISGAGHTGDIDAGPVRVLVEEPLACPAEIRR